MSTNKQYLENFSKNFDIIFKEIEKGIEEKKWHFKYDDISDILYFIPVDKQVSKDSVMIPAEDSGISARIGPSGIEAFIVEEFGDVFVQENPEFKLLYNKLSRKDEIEKNTSRRACAILLSDFRNSRLGAQPNPAF